MKIECQVTQNGHKQWPNMINCFLNCPPKKHFLTVFNHYRWFPLCPALSFLFQLIPLRFLAGVYPFCGLGFPTLTTLALASRRWLRHASVMPPNHCRFLRRGRLTFPRRWCWISKVCRTPCSYSNLQLDFENHFPQQDIKQKNTNEWNIIKMKI